MDSFTELLKKLLIYYDYYDGIEVTKTDTCSPVWEN